MRRGWHHRGYLPHCDCDELIQHVVFRLNDSLPRDLLRSLAALGVVQQRKRVDSILDRGCGEALLRRADVAEIVAATLRAFDGERYCLQAWCIMPTHVHAIVQPLGGHDLGKIVKTWKAYSAAQANRLLGRSGAFWAPDYFDRFMRDDDHLGTTIAYVESNPVKAGLCAQSSLWRHSSAWRALDRASSDAPFLNTRCDA